MLRNEWLGLISLDTIKPPPRIGIKEVCCLYRSKAAQISFSSLFWMLHGFQLRHLTVIAGCTLPGDAEDGKTDIGHSVDPVPLSKHVLKIDFRFYIYIGNAPSSSESLSS